MVFSILISNEDGYFLKIKYFSTKEFDSISLIRSILLIKKILFKLKFFIFFSKNNSLNNQLPFIFGNPEVNEFFNIKEIIDKSKISYTEIKNLYFFPSKRWDLELRDNTIIKLPNDNINLALNLAIEFLNDHKFIDARIKNQIILDD